MRMRGMMREGEPAHTSEKVIWFCLGFAGLYCTHLLNGSGAAEGRGTRLELDPLDA